jgi:hypothetical protein
MDEDGSGDVSYEEFVDSLYRMKSQNSRTLLVFIKYYVLEMRRNVQEELELLKGDILTKITGVAKAEGDILKAEDKILSKLRNQDRMLSSLHVADGDFSASSMSQEVLQLRASLQKATVDMPEPVMLPADAIDTNGVKSTIPVEAALKMAMSFNSSEVSDLPNALEELGKPGPASPGLDGPEIESTSQGEGQEQMNVVSFKMVEASSHLEEDRSQPPGADLQPSDQIRRPLSSYRSSVGGPAPTNVDKSPPLPVSSPSPPGSLPPPLPPTANASKAQQDAGKTDAGSPGNGESLLC